MRGAIKRKADAMIAAIMAIVFALSLSGVPASALADAGNGNATNGSQNEINASVSGIDFLQPGMTDLEVLKVDNLGSDTIYITVNKDGKPLSNALPYTAERNDNAKNAQIAQILTIQLPSNAVNYDEQLMVGLYGDINDKTRYSIDVHTDMMQGKELFSGKIYPVYAKTTKEDGSVKYHLMGIRTTSDPYQAKNLHVSSSYYTHYEGEETATTYSLSWTNGIDNYFSEEQDAFIVTYNEDPEESISGLVNYVNPDGELVYSDPFGGIDENGKTVPIREFFIGNDNNYYRVASTLGGKSVKLTLTASTQVINVIPVNGLDEEAYKVKINYVDNNGKLLWSDKVAVNGYGYRYTLPNSFSMAYENPLNKTEGVESYSLYEVVGGTVVTTETPDQDLAPASDTSTSEGAGSTGDVSTDQTTTDKPFAGIGTAVLLTANLVEANFDGMEDECRVVTAKYLPSSLSKQATFTLEEIDGETGKTLSTTTELITPEHSFSYVPAEKVINGKKYVPWSGNPKEISYTWDNLKDGRELLQRVYYVPEGYTPGAPYNITVQYMNIANSQILHTETLSVDPEMTDYVEYVGDPRFTQGENTYVRLAGQDSGIRHAYLAGEKTYTIYYRDINDTINANTTVTRTQIVETTRTVVVPGGITAAPVEVDAEAGEPGVEAGVGAGDGTVIINDDDNPLANLNGEDTTSERIIAENENPLAKPASSGAQALGIATAIAAAGLIGFLIFSRYRRRKFNDQIKNL